MRLNYLCETFGLSAFERDAFLLCLAPALDLHLEQIFGFLQNDVNRKRPTVSLLVNLLAAPGLPRLQAIRHFGARSRLVKSRLLVPIREPGAAESSQLAQSLAVDRTVVAWLLGYYEPSSDLLRMVKYEDEDDRDAEHAPLAEEISTLVTTVATVRDGILLFHAPTSRLIVLQEW